MQTHTHNKVHRTRHIGIGEKGEEGWPWSIGRWEKNPAGALLRRTKGVPSAATLSSPGTTELAFLAGRRRRPVRSIVASEREKVVASHLDNYKRACGDICDGHLHALMVRARKWQKRRRGAGNLMIDVDNVSARRKGMFGSDSPPTRWLPPVERLVRRQTDAKSLAVSNTIRTCDWVPQFTPKCLEFGECVGRWGCGYENQEKTYPNIIWDEQQN